MTPSPKDQLYANPAPTELPAFKETVNPLAVVLKFATTTPQTVKVVEIVSDEPQ